MSDIQDRKQRLANVARRLREESNMDARAAAASQNPDAAPVFAAWSKDKLQTAEDIEALLLLV